MNFLITGISSYIARYTAQKILALGHRVIGISRTSPRLHHENFNWIKSDLSREKPSLNAPIDFIIHMAAVAKLDKTATDYFESNLLLTNNIKKMALKIKPKAIFYTSSIKIYGEITCDTVDEQTPVINPDLYGMSKYFGEKLLEESAPTISIRMPGTIANGSYGWIDSVYKKLHKDKTIDLKNSRYNHVIHAADIAGFILKSIKAKTFETDQFNICASGLSTSLDVVLLMKEQLHSASEIENSQDSGFHILSNEKISSHFKPMSVEETIKLYLKEMQETI